MRMFHGRNQDRFRRFHRKGSLIILLLLCISSFYPGHFYIFNRNLTRCVNIHCFHRCFLLDFTIFAFCIIFQNQICCILCCIQQIIVLFTPMSISVKKFAPLLTFSTKSSFLACAKRQLTFLAKTVDICLKTILFCVSMNLYIFY